MLKAGITGGIGSGKSVVCQVFTALGIPVFNADEAARYLMDNDPALVHSIRHLLGNDIYSGMALDRKKVAAIVYKDPAALHKLNALVHPVTVSYSHKWIAMQQAPYIIKEAAIFFESNSYRDMDVMIGVFAPEELRVQRAMQRGGLNREQVAAIIDEQMNEEEKMKRCDYVITNDGQTAVLPQVLDLHKILTRNAQV